MIYKVTGINRQVPATTIYMHGRTMNVPGPLEISIDIAIISFTPEEVESLETVEAALRGEIVVPGAPTYHELLKQYHPEFLL